MSYIGNTPTSIAFLTDLFTGTGSLSVFTMSAAPDSTSSILVSITGVVQEPSTYSVSGNTLTFSQAPPAGTGNISIRYLGIPASGVVSTAYRTVTEFTATLAQTIFTVPSYTVGYITVYRNGVRLGTADYTATSGTNVILGTAANTGDLITTESFYVSSVLNAIPAVAGAITSSYILDGAVGTAEIASGVTLSSPNTSGNLNFSGTAQRITGDMTNATITNRLAFQTSTANTQTVLTVIPNGTSTAAAISLESDSNLINDIYLQASSSVAGSLTTGFYSGIRGTGTYSPMTFFTGGSEKLRLDTSGNLLVGTTSASVPSTTGFVSSANTFGFKNRIINGGMVIDQRNAGASVTPNPTTTVYSVDRFMISAAATSKYTAQRNAGSITPPAGFSNYLGCTVTSAYTPVGNESFNIQTRIEGYNTADFAFGTASAATSTLSFWVRSSLVGTYGGEIYSSAARTYPFSYSIPVANTWTRIVLTITGDTVSATDVTNGYGLIIVWGLGTAGAALGGTINTWQAGNFTQPAGTVNWISNAGATFYITGVQLEKGSVATSFDQRAYSQELAMCQRYYYKYNPQNWWGLRYSGTSPWLTTSFPVTMRAVPTVVPSFTSIFCTTGTLNSMPVYSTTVDSVSINYYTSVVSTDFGANLSYTASAEL